jgi:flagellar biosynthesis/type III secretory pathway chaperone
MNRLEPLTNILNQQVLSYEQLYELLKKEKACLVRYDCEGFEQLAKEKDCLIIQLNLLEEERARLVDKFFVDNGILGDRNITRLWEISGDSMLMSIKYRLLSLMQGIEELNNLNRVLIHKSLNHLSASSGFFNAIDSGMMKTTAGVFSREA